MQTLLLVFQSTLPVWGVTYTEYACMRTLGRFQSTLPVWGVTATATAGDILSGFQSTLPVWGVTLGGYLVVDYSGISIHTPRVGSD